MNHILPGSLLHITSDMVWSSPPHSSHAVASHVSLCSNSSTFSDWSTPVSYVGGWLGHRVQFPSSCYENSGGWKIREPKQAMTGVHPLRSSSEPGARPKEGRNGGKNPPPHTLLRVTIGRTTANTVTHSVECLPPQNQMVGTHLRTKQAWVPLLWNLHSCMKKRHFKVNKYMCIVFLRWA